MAIQQDFSLIRQEDGILSVSLQNPTNISTWSLVFEAANRFGSESGLIFKSADATHTAGQSGITYTNAVQGMFNIAIAANDTSGFDFKNLSYGITRTDAGNRTCLAEGFFSILPSIQ